MAEILRDTKGDKTTRVFARELGIHHATLTRLLKGDVSPDILTIYKISQKSSYSMGELIAIACGESPDIPLLKTSEDAIKLIREMNPMERIKLVRMILEEMPKEERNQAFIKLVDVLVSS